MIIFVLDEHPKKAAQMQCDKHIPKMCVETAQILMSAYPEDITTPYKKTQVNNRYCRWARESQANFEWLLTHGEALCTEYTFRFSKTHKSQAVLSWVRSLPPELPQREMSLPPLPGKYEQHSVSHLQEVISLYRLYYHSKTFARWDHGRPAPSWFLLGEEE